MSVICRQDLCPIAMAGPHERIAAPSPDKINGNDAADRGKGATI
jgi:hypothetical protein